MPPAEAKLVETFYNPNAPNPAYAAVPEKLPDVIGRYAPKLTYHETDGSVFDTSTLKGHPVLLDLWATWCGPTC